MVISEVMMNTPNLKAAAGGAAKGKQQPNASPYGSVGQPGKFVKDGKNSAMLAKVSPDD